MPVPYSKDLRERSIDLIESKKYTQKEVAIILGIDNKTLYNWKKQKAIKGHLDAKTGYQQGHSHIVTDLEEFKKIVEKKDISTRQDIENEMQKGSTSSIGRLLKKIGFVKKSSNNI